MPLLPGFEKPLLAHAFTQHCHGKHQLNYQEFLELSTNSITGLGLQFKPGQAEALFQKVDSNHDGNIDIFELMTYFSKSHDEDDFDEMPVKKRIALVAHDKFKDQMVSSYVHSCSKSRVTFAVLQRSDKERNFAKESPNS